MKKTKKYRSTKLALFSRVQAEERRSRLVDLAMLVLITVVPVIVPSTYMFLSGESLYANTPSTYYAVSGIVYSLSGMAFMMYLLARQGRKLSDIGCSFSWWDLLIAVGLFGVQHLLSRIVHWVSWHGYYTMVGRPPDLSAMNIGVFEQVSLWMILRVVIVSVYEELLVRGYVMSETKYLWGSWSIAVIASIVLQLSYHTYQGMGALIRHFATFLIYALYYAKWKRLTPVILAHVFANMYTYVHIWFFA